jgi:hypothetical protein
MASVTCGTGEKPWSAGVIDNFEDDDDVLEIGRPGSRDNGAIIGAAPTDQNESAIAATTAALAANIRMATASGRIIVGMIGLLPALPR